jgi:diguanylate cyclase (GGDEF)-like protein
MLISAKDLAALAASRLFAEVPAGTLRSIFTNAIRRDVAAGTRVIAPGEPHCSLYIVIRGELGVFADKDAKFSLSTIGPGDCVGEQSVLDHGKPAALVVATAATRLAVLRAEQIWEAMYRAPVIALNLLRVLSERIRHDNDTLRASFDRQALFEAAATTDKLTGLHNRQWMEDSFGRELLRCSHAGTPAALFMIDLDHFKSINDRFGHRVGDAVLARFGELIRNALRPRDLCARFGGEEFCVLLPEIDARKALQAAERLRARVNAQPAEVSRDLMVNYTVSIGVAAWQPGSGIADLIDAADAALYAAKRAGRNRVELAAPRESRDETVAVQRRTKVLANAVGGAG